MDNNLRLTRFQMHIEQYYDSLAQQEKKVADYLMSNEEDILDTTIASISEGSGVSKACVVRFCKDIGFSGLKEFKMALVSGTLNMKDSFSPAHWDDPPESIFRKFFTQAIKVMEISHSQTDPAAISLSAKRLANGNTIDIIGVGGSAIIAKYCAQEFQRLGKRSTSYTDPYSINALSHTLSGCDILIAISCSGETKEILETARILKEKGSFIIAISSYSDSPLAELADAVIVTPARHVFYNDDHSFSRLAQMGMITTLYITTATEMAKKDVLFRLRYIEQTRYKPGAEPR